MLNYFIPVTNIFKNKKNYKQDSPINDYITEIYLESHSSITTMIPELILQLVINQFGSTEQLFEKIDQLKSEWVILLFNPSTMKIELKTDIHKVSLINICLVLKQGDSFENVEWDIVRNRYNLIIKLQ